MSNNYKDFKTLGELGIYVQGKFEYIEKFLEQLTDRPDKIGKWFVRIFLVLVAIAQIVILYKTMTGGK